MINISYVVNGIRRFRETPIFFVLTFELMKQIDPSKKQHVFIDFISNLKTF